MPSVSGNRRIRPDAMLTAAFDRPTVRAGARPLRLATGLIACLLLAGGCAGGKMIAIADEADFRQRVLQADRPVLVEFYKAGCATCVVLEPTLDRLADEYRGRVIFAKFKLMTGLFVVTSHQLLDEYDINTFPTVLLFADGKIRNRWVLRYGIDEYRRGLDAVLFGGGVGPRSPTTEPSG